MQGLFLGCWLKPEGCPSTDFNGGIGFEPNVIRLRLVCGNPGDLVSSRMLFDRE